MTVYTEDGEGNGNPWQYSCLENSMDRGAWQATVHGVARVGHDWVTKPPTPYIEDPKDVTGKLHELISKFGKVSGYKINTQKSVAFLYTKYKRSERETKK